MLESLWVSIIFVALGCVLLAYGADRFISASVQIAKNFHVPPLVIGMALVGFATSLPELVVSAMAAWHGNSVMGIGNALGSNITNIGLVIGLTALISPLRVKSILLKREFPLLFLVMLVSILLCMNGDLNRIDGLVLLLGFVLLIFWLSMQAKSAANRRDPMIAEFRIVKSEMPIYQAIIWLMVGLILLLLGSHILIFAAVSIAKHFGLSELVIGLTIVAISTSLPELAASMVAGLRHEDEIALGNVLGSNMFNLLGVMAMPALIDPTKVPHMALIRDYPMMFGFTIALYFMAFGLKGRVGQIGRVKASILLLGFFGYLLLLYRVF